MKQLDDVLKRADHQRAIVLVYLGGPCVIRWRQRGTRKSAEAKSFEVACRRAAVEAIKATP